jgi:hypothetical protein
MIGITVAFVGAWPDAFAMADAIVMANAWLEGSW